MTPLFTRLAAMLALAWALVLSPGAGAMAQDSYRIRPGDVLRIEVLEDSALNRSALVSPDGRVALALAGSVMAAGRTIEEVQASLATQLASNFAVTPSVFVSVERLAETVARAPRTPAPPPTMDVYVLGEVRTPGKLTVAPGTTVLQLFAQMGGFTNFAATRRVQLRRTGNDGAETVYTLDYDAIEQGISPNGTAVLADGDVIVVPQRRLFE